MNEFRYLIRDGEKILQYRQMINFIRSSTNEETKWGAWKDVEIVEENAEAEAS